MMKLNDDAAQSNELSIAEFGQIWKVRLNTSLEFLRQQRGRYNQE